MTTNYSWRQIGNGKKIHVFFGEPSYSLCGLGGEVSFVWRIERSPKEFPICKNCQRMLKNSKHLISECGQPV